MSYSFIKRKLGQPEHVQIGKDNVASLASVVNKTEELETQVSLSTGYSILFVCALLIVISFTYILQKRNKKVTSRK